MIRLPRSSGAARDQGNVAADEGDRLPEPDPPPPRSMVRPFLVGTVLGAIAGTALGTALSPHTRGFFVGLYHLLAQRLTAADRDQLRFELLLQ